MILGKRLKRIDYGQNHTPYKNFKDTLYDEYFWFEWRICYTIQDELKRKLYDMRIARIADDMSFRLKIKILKL